MSRSTCKAFAMTLSSVLRSPGSGPVTGQDTSEPSFRSRHTTPGYPGCDRATLPGLDLFAAAGADFTGGVPSELAPVSLAAIAGMAAIALGVVLSPGPNMIYLVSRSITQGRRAGLISLAGVAAGFAVYLVAATLGLTAVFTAVPQLYLAVKLAGAGYLAFLAWKTLRPGG